MKNRKYYSTFSDVWTDREGEKDPRLIMNKLDEYAVWIHNVVTHQCLVVLRNVM